MKIFQAKFSLQFPLILFIRMTNRIFTGSPKAQSRLRWRSWPSCLHNPKGTSVNTYPNNWTAPYVLRFFVKSFLLVQFITQPNPKYLYRYLRDRETRREKKRKELPSHYKSSALLVKIYFKKLWCKKFSKENTIKGIGSLFRKLKFNPEMNYFGKNRNFISVKKKKRTAGSRKFKTSNGERQNSDALCRFIRII